MKRISCIAAAVALVFGFVACAPELPGILDPLGITKEDDDSSSPSAVTTTTPVAAAAVNSLTLSAAPTLTGSVAKVSTTKGIFTFTNTPAVSSSIANRTVDSSKNGTWKFVHTAGHTYEGTYVGDISNIATTGAELTLTVKKLSGNDVTAQPFDFSFTGITVGTAVTATIPSVTNVAASTPAAAEYTLTQNGTTHYVITAADETYTLKNSEKTNIKESGKYKKAGSFLFLKATAGEGGTAIPETSQIESVYSIGENNALTLYTTPTPPAEPTPTINRLAKVDNETKEYTVTTSSGSAKVNTTASGTYTVTVGTTEIQSGTFQTYKVTQTFAGLAVDTIILVSLENNAPKSAYVVSSATALREASNTELTALIALANGEEPPIDTVTKEVDGTWDFTTADTYAIGSSGYTAVTYTKDLTNADAKGVTLSLFGSAKWGNGKADDTANFCIWFSNKSAWVSGGPASEHLKYGFTIVTEDTAKLSVVASGNGSSSSARWLALYKNGTFVTEKVLENLGSDVPDKTLTATLEAGTYTIYTSGTRVRKITITNQAFSSRTEQINNDADTLGLVATTATPVDATVATAAVANGKITITSLAPGSTTVSASDGTGTATINVSVDPVGKITTSVTKYVAFTAATNSATEANIATLGLVGATATSSAPAIATAAITDGKVVITSLAEGTATITVKDSANKDDVKATIAVTVAKDGTITLGTITKYERAAPAATTDYTVDGLKLTAVNAIEYSSDGTTWTKLAATEVYTAQTDGSVKVRLPASEAYAASKEATVSLAASGNGGSGNLTTTYNADFKALTGGTAVTADTYVAGNDGTSAPKIDLSGFPTASVPLIVNGAAKNGIRLRKDTNNINYNGGTAAAFTNTTVGEILSETLDRYIALDVSKLATSGNVKVTFTGIAKTSAKGTANLGQVVLIDQAKKVLASATNLKIDSSGTAEGVDSFTLTTTIDASTVTTVTLGFSRGGVGGGGIDVTAIKAEPAN